MAFLFITISFFFLSSCIPLRIAPDIDDYRITRGNSFKRNLLKREMFVFEDPKDTDHFYNYVNKKFHLNNENVYDDVPFKLEEQQYFFSFASISISSSSQSSARSRSSVSFFSFSVMAPLFTCKLASDISYQN